jgi:hypothetical protein
MVLEWIALHAAVESLWVIAAARLAAEIVQHVVVAVAFIQKPSDLQARVAVDVLDASSGEPMDDNTRGQINQIQIKGVFDISFFLSRHGMTARP